MHILTATTRNGETLYYTGRAGAAWVSADRSEAFDCGSAEGVQVRAKRHNEYTSLHGLTFKE